MERVVVGDHRATDDVRVAAEILRGAVDDDRGPERQRILKAGCREGVVDAHPGAARETELGQRGEVRNLQLRVAGRFHPHHAARSSERPRDIVEPREIDE